MNHSPQGQHEIGKTKDNTRDEMVYEKKKWFQFAFLPQITTLIEHCYLSRQRSTLGNCSGVLILEIASRLVPCVPRP